MNHSHQPKVTYLADYTPPDYWITTVVLHFELDETSTTVHSQLTIQRNKDANLTTPPLILDGEALDLLSIQLNNQTLSPNNYQLTSTQLRLESVPEHCILSITTQLNPRANTALSGLYISRGIFCTQCEAQGFRRITYFIDRPDVLARYSTTISANKERYPILLANGNPSQRGQHSDGRHFVRWDDPFKKPSYLFALVAGNLDCLEDEFRTISQRRIRLQIFCEKGDVAQCEHAMASLKTVMHWDEQAYGREYDLAIYMIVAIGDFNMGAMENKGLNIFNAHYILADPRAATDNDYEAITEVVGHEYLHNWTGNRITCRDWFQLSLKEGLTVFREQEFMEHITASTVTRIRRAKYLRTVQFAQDASPLAHPVQPESYIAINNFYTPTVYEKGAEIIRMLKILLGPTKFRQAMDLYFVQYDGQAVTLEQLMQVMEEASGYNLAQFRRWYKQAGTPIVQVDYSYCANTRTLTLTLRQAGVPTPGQPDKQALHIPIAMALLGQDGQALPLQLIGDTHAQGPYRLLELLRDDQQQWQFINVPTPSIPSLLRGFSAPVKLASNYNDAELGFIVQHDTDAFNRWDALQQLACRLLLRYPQPPADWTEAQAICEVFQQLLLADGDNDPRFTAELLTLPSEAYVSEQTRLIDVDAIHNARQSLKRYIAQQLYQPLLHYYQKVIRVQPYAYQARAVGQRCLQNSCLSYLMALAKPDVLQLCWQQYELADNMTDTLAALTELVSLNVPGYETLLDNFYQKWQHNSLVIDKWLAVQARTATLPRIKELLKHSSFNFKNPNKVRALLGSFCRENLVQFHHCSGDGYAFLAEQVLTLDALNPQVAAYLLEPLTRWPRYHTHRQVLMRSELNKIVNTQHLSSDVYEIATKSLEPGLL